jgi:predicted DNA-binding transcriptional regulator YafY
MAPERELHFTYTNWRGETRPRRVQPQRIWFGTTEWHPEKQWFIEAVDLEGGAMRDFALRDMVFDK